jgi:hypothetical protein
LFERRWDVFTEICVVRMSDDQAGVFSEQYRFMVISKYSSQVTYIQKKKQWTKYGSLRNTTANLPPFRITAMAGIFACY